ncbi:MAG: calcineurin-like phosphoesterase family protein [Pseudomonadota bacterium]
MNRCILRPLLTSLALCAPLVAQAKMPDYRGGVQIIGEAEDQSTARGTVFRDVNRNSRMDDGERGIGGVLVSNGRDVVVTQEDGTYSLPAYDDMNLFITKPRDRAVPVNDDLVPQFFYIHKRAGSPDLRFGGLDPTGPLPAEINFPLVGDPVGDRFECLIFGDAQTYSNTEVGYVRETVGRMLTSRDLSETECLIFEGDVMGDDLSLYPRLKRIVAIGGVPQYFVAGNHDVDFDAETDQDSFDTFRREWGPEYYSFDIGDVHFVVLDNVRYPCNGVDDHPFCAPGTEPTYNAVISDRQMTWLAADLAQVPEDKLIVLNAHIPFQTFTDNTSPKGQTDNFAALVALLGDRPVLGLSGHTHTTENLRPGTSYEGWEEHTGLAAAPFHQIVTGAVSGSWWAGDRNDAGVPHGTQRLGAPRGYYSLTFDGPDYVDTYNTFATGPDEQLHAAFSTPRFRDWAWKLFAYTILYDTPSDIMPPVSINDLGDMYMLTTRDLQRDENGNGGSWVAVNVWNGGLDTQVEISLNGGPAMAGRLLQPGQGEAKRSGIDYADPLALARQSTQSDATIRSFQGGDETAGYRMWDGTEWVGVAGPFPRWMLSNSSNHLWRIDLPTDLPVGVHRIDVRATDYHGRTFDRSYPFEIVEQLPEPHWQKQFWEEPD